MIGKGDIRVSFERAILEASMASLRRKVWSSYDTVVKGPKPRGTKTKEIIRARFGNNLNGVAENNIRLVLTDAGIKITDIKLHEPGRVRDGKSLGSNDYYTFEIKTDIGILWITNSTIELDDGTESQIAKKALTPNAIGIEDTIYKSPTVLIKDIKSGLKTIRGIDDNIKEVLVLICESINKNTKTTHKDMSSFYSEEVKVSIAIDDIDPSFELDLKSIRNIVNDFGEVLDGLYLLNTIKSVGSGLQFPGAANESLSDLYFDGYNVSSKASKGGGKPGIGALINIIYDSKLTGVKYTPDSSSESDLHEILLSIKEKASKSGMLDTVMTYITIAQLLDKSKTEMPGISYLLEVSGLDINGITDRAQLISFLINLAEESESSFNDFLIEFWKRSSIKPKDKPDAKKFLKNENASMLYYPIAVELTRILNDKYRKDLNTLINKFLVVKQMYFAISFNTYVVSIVSKSSNNSKNSKFMARGSAKTFNAGLAYEMK